MAIFGISGAVKEVIIPQSAVFHADDTKSARRLVGALRKYVGLMTKYGFYCRFEFPVKVVQAYRATGYLGQLSAAGHCSVIEGAASPRHNWSDVLAALNEIGAEQHLAIATRMSGFLAQYPTVDSFRNAADDEQQSLKQLDREFRALEKTTSLDVLLARWISSWPELKIVADSDYLTTVRAVAKKSPHHDIGQASRLSKELAKQMLDRREVALSLACSRIPNLDSRIEIKILAAFQWSVVIDGEPQVVCHVRTNVGLRYGLLTDTHAAIYERIEVQPFGAEERLIDCIREGRHPKPGDAIVGKRLSLVTFEAIDEVIALAERYRAHIALDMLSRRVGISDEKRHVAPLVVRHEPGEPVVRWAVVTPDRAAGFEIGPNGAILLGNGNRQILARVSNREIDKQSERIGALRLRLEQAALSLHC